MRFSALGDVIQTLPILTMLRDGFPEAKIGWAIDTGLTPAIEGHPALDYIHRCSRREWSRALANPAKWAHTYGEFQAFIADIRSVGYDVAVDVQGLFKTALVPYLAGIRRRIGYRHGREFSSMFYTERFLERDEYFDPSVSHLQHMAALARSIGAGEVRQTIEPPVIRESARNHVSQLLDGAFAAPAPIVAIAPATQWESKMWPLEYWSALLRQILDETDLNLIVQGSANDAKVGEQIMREFTPAQLKGRVCDLFGKLPIAEMYALYEQVQVAIGSDSAPLHVAGAMRVPILIGLYGPTGYRRTPPVGSPHIRLFSTEGELPCQPCHKRVCPLGTTECMKRITPSDVFRALLEELNRAEIPFTYKGSDTVSTGRLVSLQ